MTAPQMQSATRSRNQSSPNHIHVATGHHTAWGWSPRPQELFAKLRGIRLWQYRGHGDPFVQSPIKYVKVIVYDYGSDKAGSVAARLR